MTKYNITIGDKKTTYRMPFYFNDFFRKEINKNNEEIKKLINSLIIDFDINEERKYQNRNEMINHIIFTEIMRLTEKRKQQSLDLT